MNNPTVNLPAESLWLAPYAMHAVDTAGREHPETAHPYRTPFQRDRDRIVHSSAYRRLAHKTQVFTGDRGDYHRTRLTHTLEVASVARTIGRVLRLNEDLIEALALMHDIGHPPFGHAGEDVLNECASDVGGFNHNQHAVRIVTLLESRYPRFPGLNLSREVLSGQQNRVKTHATSEQPLLEVQVVDAADSIAYDSHDADDALELGLLAWEELLDVPLWRDAAERVEQRSEQLDQTQLRRAVIHQLIEIMVSDLIDHSLRRLANTAGLDLPQAARNQVEPLIGVSHPLQQQMAELESFLFDKVYRHPTVLAERALAGDALREMFARFCEHPESLPTTWRERLDEEGVARTVCDYLAGMTDRYALEEHRRHASFAG